MNGNPKCKIRLACLPGISPDQIIELVSDLRIAIPMPLLTFFRDSNTIAELVIQCLR